MHFRCSSTLREQLSFIAKEPSLLGAATMACILALGIRPSAAAVPDCSTLNLVSPVTAGFSLNMSGQVQLQAGDVVYMEVTATGGQIVTLNVGNTGTTGNIPTTISVGANASGVTTVRGSITGAGNLPTGNGAARIYCSAGGSEGGSNAGAQSSANARAAVTYGQITVQNYADRISKAVMGSFSLMAGASPRSEAAAARSRFDKLKQQEFMQAEELADLRSSSTAHPAAGHAARIAMLEQTLAATRRNLALAQISRPTATSMMLSNADAGSAQAAGPEGAFKELSSGGIATARKPEAMSVTDTMGVPQASTARSIVKLDARDLMGVCAAGDGSSDRCDGFGPEWNAWAEARVIGGTDSLTRARALGFIASAGTDYKFTSWLAAGLTLGIENFESRFGNSGVGLGTLGFSAVPYMGVRLSDTVYATAFAGVSTINYNATPAVGVSAAFNATRLFFGTSLIGNWHHGAWRFQPTLMGTFGSEFQNGYTDSIGNDVNSQSASFGRIVLSPEIGYTITNAERGWAMEPFILARIGVDFASNTVALTNGQSVIVRPGTLGFGGLGGGVAMQFQNGGYLRAQASYDSIGVSGLTLWSAVLRAGITF